MQTSVSLSLDTVNDVDILRHIEWLRANRPRQVSAWLRDMVRLGMSRSGEQTDQKLDRILALLETGAVVQVAPAREIADQRDGALDRLGV